MASSTPRQRKPKDELGADEELPPRSRRRIDPEDTAEYTEWIDEKRHKGRKKRREGERDRRRDRDREDGP
jgi:hypothetical protein